MTDDASDPGFSPTDRLRATVAGLHRASGYPERSAVVLAAVAVLVLVASLTFPQWALDAYEVNAESVAEPRGDARVVAYEDLSPRGQRVVERAVAGEAVTIYAPFYAHQGEGGALPPLFTDNWIDSYSVGAVVRNDGQLYEVSTTGGVPFHAGIVTPVGALLGLLLLALARTTKRASGPIHAFGVLVGLVVLAALLWFGDAHGYVWPVQ